MKLPAALAALAILALLWIASEEHYQGCVSAAEATTAAPQVEGGRGRYGEVWAERANGAERAAAVADCSRLP